MNPYLLASIVGLITLVLGYVAKSYLAARAPAKFVVDAEAEAMKIIETQINFMADSSGDQKAIAAANARIVARQKRIADLQAKVAGLTLPTITG